MKIAIIGGGPAGLYAAILLRKQRPNAEITVYERNRADDTFGFGVGFSDATLDNFEKYDPPSYRRITETFRPPGAEGLSERQWADRMAQIFERFLDGYPLLTNGSMSRNFPMIRSRRWVKDNRVRLGDAKARAHFSIGSGPKLAMEDAIA